ncbi:Vgb family protein [Thalassotalea atypica]|uniref:Vgb family protein n=1 Tax=Thalassotalea atypica TaxID=2054316 RepID=UPI00257431F3|nr:hypothetical protein [Thalassotalea atypica]
MNKLTVFLSAFLASLVGFAGSTSANTYTTNAQFDLGILNSVNHDNPNDDQLQLSTTGSTFPLLWAANAGEDSVSKVDTDADCEVARYATWHIGPFHSAWSGPAPSRTAVDSEGNVFVANRQFDGRPMNVLKILSEGGVDRNGNGVIDTSTDVNGDCIIDRSDPAEFLPPVDDNLDGILQTSEIRDERVVWINHVGPANSLGRSLCIGTDGNLWMGDYTNRSYYKVQASDGAVLAGPIATTGSLSPYGCLVDGDGILYSSSLSSTMGILDTNTNTWLATLNTGASVYGIAIGNGMVYTSGSGSYRQYDQNSGVGEPDGNPATGTFSSPGDVGNSTLGISVDGDGSIVLGQSPIRKYSSAGVTQWATPNAASDTRGVVPDSNNNIWAVNRGSNNSTKFNKDTGNLMATVPLGNQPYTYSDATGFAATNTTDPSGIWTIIEDGGDAGNPWDEISWNNEPEGSIPAGGSITVEARVSDTQVGLGLETYAAMTNGLSGIAMNGRFIQVRATLRPGDNGESPVLSDLSIEPLVIVNEVKICDVDLDDDIDRVDLRAISLARNQTALPDDPRDANFDGTITPSDIKVCIPLCTLPRCAIVDNGPL